MTTYVQPVMRRRNQRFAKVSAEYIGRQNEEITDRARIDIGKCGGIQVRNVAKEVMFSKKNFN